VTEADGRALLVNTVTFGRVLRRAGLPVEPEQTRLFLAALTRVGLEDPVAVRAAGRAVFVRRREDLALFDRAFALFWRRHAPADEGAPLLPRIRQEDLTPPTFPAPGAVRPAPGGREAPPDADRVQVLAGAAERLRTADFAALTAAEANEALDLLASARLALPMRPSRRWRRARRGARPALRLMLRAATRSDGVPLLWRWLRHRRRPRPLVLVVDISGSMERYSRLLARFAHVLAHSGAPVEVFLFGTRLTRVTRTLRHSDADTALRQMGRSVRDWNGGTRIGESLRELNRCWVRRTVRSGSVVLLASDGWESGDPTLLAREMATLRRSCHRLLWLDPLAGQPGFAPEVSGLRAALPHIDGLVPCASVADLLGVMVGLGGSHREEKRTTRPPHPGAPVAPAA